MIDDAAGGCNARDFLEVLGEVGDAGNVEGWASLVVVGGGTRV